MEIHEIEYIGNVNIPEFCNDRVFRIRRCTTVNDDMFVAVGNGKVVYRQVFCVIDNVAGLYGPCGSINKDLG